MMAKVAEDEEGANATNSTPVQVEPGYYGGVPSFMRFGGSLPENFCDSPMPSPIVIDTSKAKLQDSLSEFEFLNMGQNFSIQMYFPEDGTDLCMVDILRSPQNVHQFSWIYLDGAHSNRACRSCLGYGQCSVYFKGQCIGD